MLLHKRVFQFNSNFQLKLKEKKPPIEVNWYRYTIRIRTWSAPTHFRSKRLWADTFSLSVAKRLWLCCASMCVTVPYELSAFTWGMGEVTFSFTFPKRFFIIRRLLCWVNEGAGVWVREPVGVGYGDNKVVDVFLPELSWRHL